MQILDELVDLQDRLDRHRAELRSLAENA